MNFEELAELKPFELVLVSLQLIIPTLTYFYCRLNRKLPIFQAVMITVMVGMAYGLIQSIRSILFEGHSPVMLGIFALYFVIPALIYIFYRYKRKLPASKALTRAFIVLMVTALITGALAMLFFWWVVSSL